MEADYFLRDNDYPLAIERLEKAIPFVKKKKYRVRHLFTLADLYPRTGNKTMAGQYYNEVINANPHYDLSFQSKLRLAEVAESVENIREVRAYLEQLTRDDKNISYYDQIYFVLAKLDYTDGNIAGAKSNLNKSIQSSKDNTTQRAMSYLMMGDIHFAERSYLPSKSYYDSAGRFLSKDYPDYEEFNNRQKVLGDLITNLVTYETQDSLLRFIAKPRDEQERIIDDIIEQETIARESSQENVNNMQAAFPFDANQTMQAPTIPGSGRPGISAWDDPAILQQGMNDFLRMWGDRPLQDNWRRRTTILKTAITNTAPSDSVLNDGNPVSLPGLEDVPADRMRFYKGLPITAVQQNISKNQIQDALFNIGNIYNTQLKEDDKALEYYLLLLTRYPDSKYLLNVWYNVYKIYTDKGDNATASGYAQKIINKFPESDVALLIKDPVAYGQKFESRRQNPALEAFYLETYNNFKEGNCSNVVLALNEANGRFSPNYLADKFDYMRVICHGRNDTASFVDSLYTLAKRHPGTEVARQSMELAKQLDKTPAAKVQKVPEQPTQPNGTPKPKTSYKLRNESVHHFLIIVNTDQKTIDQIKDELTVLNQQYFSAQSLSVLNFLYDKSGNQQVILVRGFTSNKQAMNYFNFIQQRESLLQNLAAPTLLAISDDNFKTLMSSKDLQGYIEFFNENYPK
ncbi:MAG: tetratricopeptide repeat protein [Bacteroidota bacterium]|nr:tetratricopeptide repeat protein [Bacteroidota bacterium]